MPSSRPLSRIRQRAPPHRDPPVDRIVTDAERDKLCSRDEAVLVRGELGESGRRRIEWRIRRGYRGGSSTRSPCRDGGDPGVTDHRANVTSQSPSSARRRVTYSRSSSSTAGSIGGCSYSSSVLRQISPARSVASRPPLRCQRSKFSVELNSGR